MPAQADTNKGPGRRTRRQPKRDQSTEYSAINGQNPGVSIDDQKDTLKPTHILQRGESDSSHPPNDTPIPDPALLSPPPKSHPSIRGQTDNQSGTDSAPDVTKRRKSKNKVSHTKPINAPSKQIQPQAAIVAAESATNPLRPNTRTPSKAYAGPTFHNSPAASSLPIPPFLSKSVPNVDKTTSLKKMFEHDSRESTSESEGSPFQLNATPSKARHLRVESPLDIFFRADQEARTKRPQSDHTTLDNKTDGYFTNNTSLSHTSQLSPRPTRNHVRHHTDSSAAGMFPLEMEAKSDQYMNGAQISHSSENEMVPLTRLSEEQRQAQSLALKRLLNLPGTQDPPPQASNSARLSPSTGSPSPKLRAGSRSSPRLSGNPPEFPKGLEIPTPDQRRAALLALAEKQIAMPNIHNTQRPPSSGLRTEVKMPNSPASAQTPEFPFTSRPPRASNEQRNVTTKPPPAAQSDHQPRYPTSAAGNPNSPFTYTTKSNETSLKLMEDDLRRILKLS